MNLRLRCFVIAWWTLPTESQLTTDVIWSSYNWYLNGFITLHAMPPPQQQQHQQQMLLLHSLVQHVAIRFDSPLMLCPYHSYHWSNHLEFYITLIISKFSRDNWTLVKYVLFNCQMELCVFICVWREIWCQTGLSCRPSYLQLHYIWTTFWNNGKLIFSFYVMLYADDILLISSSVCELQRTFEYFECLWAWTRVAWYD